MAYVFFSSFLRINHVEGHEAVVQHYHVDNKYSHLLVNISSVDNDLFCGVLSFGGRNTRLPIFQPFLFRILISFILCRCFSCSMARLPYRRRTMRGCIRTVP